MLYSCFDDKSGVYRVYADGNDLPFNSDLPVPVLRDEKVGTPSIKAARLMPSPAAYVGTSWNAKGVVVDCNRRGGDVLSGDEGSVVDYWPAVMAIAVVGLVVWASG